MKFDRLVMLLFIDAYVDEYEVIDSNVMAYHFDVGRSTFTSLIKHYLDERPSMLRYEMFNDLKAYRKSAIFERRFNASTPSLDILESYSLLTGRPVKSLKAIRELKQKGQCASTLALNDGFL